MMTRDDFFAIRNEMHPLSSPFVLPYSVTPLLEDVILLSGDAQAATREALTREAAIAARDMFSPLIIPEMVRGSILSGKA